MTKLYDFGKFAMDADIKNLSLPDMQDALTGVWHPMAIAAIKSFKFVQMLGDKAQYEVNWTDLFGGRTTSTIYISQRGNKFKARRA